MPSASNYGYSNLYNQVHSTTNESGSNLSITQNLLKGLGGFQGRSLRDYSGSNYAINGSLVSLWTQAVATRQDYYTVSADLRRFYLVDALINLIASDVLNPDERGDIIRLESKDADVQEELNKFQNKWDLSNLLKDIIHDFVDYGEYTLSLDVKEGEGVVGISDDVNQMNVVAFYEDGAPKRFLLWEDNDFKIEPANKYVHFVSGRDKLRVKLEVLMGGSNSSGYSSNFGRQSTGLASTPVGYGGTGMSKLSKTEEFKDLPDYVRVGKPMFYGAIEKLRQLQLLEQLIPAAKLNQVSQSQLIAVKIPPAETPENISKIVRHFEEILNPPTGFNGEQMQLTLAEVMNATGKIRIVPQFMDDKGALEKLDIRQNSSVDDLLSAIKDIRSIILSSLGIPPSLLFGPDADGQERSKAQEMHLFSRYTRRLADFQYSLAQGIKHIVFTHLVNRGVKVRKTDVDVVFINRMVDLSGLEQLEFNDTKQAIVTNIFALAKTILGEDVYASFVPASIDKRNFIRWLKSVTDVLTGAGMSIFQDPEKLQFDNMAQGAGAGGMGGMGGGPPMPMSDIGGTDMGGLDSSGIPLPSGAEEPPSEGEGGEEGPEGPSSAPPPPIGSRMGAPAPGSGKVNINAK